jgi:alanyl-tRNA synthetase
MTEETKTELLFYSDPYTTEFEATVLGIEEDKKGAVVQLDRTAFYPEGGGQPADLGSIGSAPVKDVKKRDGEVLHYVDKPLDGIEEGTVLTCRIDWERRFDYMQQHSGQHLLSAVLYRDFGYQTVSVHQGSEDTTIEIDAEALKESEILQIEERVLELIGENRPIRSFWVNEDDLSSYDLRREPKVSGSIRIVEVEGYDAVACGGVHTARTGEVRLVRHAGTEKIRGRTRLYWKIGARAVDDYREKSRIVAELVDLFSSPQQELVSRIGASAQELVELRREYSRLEGRTAALEAERLLAASAVESAEEDLLLITVSYSGEGKEFLRKVAEQVAQEPRAAFCGTNESEKGLQWVIALGEKAEESIDFNQKKGELLTAIDGKGGGKPPIRQGIGQNPEGVADLFAAFRRLF